MLTFWLIGFSRKTYNLDPTPKGDFINRLIFVGEALLINVKSIRTSPTYGLNRYKDPKKVPSFKGKYSMVI